MDAPRSRELPSTFCPPWYPKYTRSYAFSSARRGAQTIKLISNHLPGGGRFTWLDGASGTGKLLCGIARFLMPLIEERGYDPSLIACDNNMEALRWKSVKEVWDQPLGVINAHLNRLPLRSRSVGFYSIFNGLEHLGERAGVYSEMRRVLQNDGILLVSGPIKSPWARAEYFLLKACGLLPKGSIDTRGDPDHKVWFTRDQLVAEITGAGFKLVGEDYYIYGSVKPFWRVLAGHVIQFFLPFSLRKFFGHGAMFAFVKND